jgi:hypothetical protein
MLPDDWLEQLRATYPKRDGGGAAPKAVTRLVNQAIANGAQWERILKGAENYRIHCGRKGMTGTEYVMMLQTFVGRDWHFEEWADQDMRTAAQVAEDRAKQALLHRAASVGFRQPIPGEPPYRYEEALKEAERALQPRAEPKLWAAK